MAQTFHRYRAGDRPVGGYKLIRKLGEGGFGEVWQAAAPGGAEVALKFIDLTGQQGFREFKSLRLVKKITHNNLTPLHGFWLKNEDGTLIDESDVTWSQIAPVAPNDPAASAALATAVFTHPVELIVAMGLGKKSLYDRLRECKDQGLGGIPADELLDYMEDAAKGIDYLNRPIHDMGHGPVPIVHSDVKPHNILIVGDGAQVCDFGLAHAVEALRKTCAAPLTLAYAAPESFRGKPSDKSDQYSLAITYVELRTGSLPFDEALTGYEVMTAHVQGQLDFTRLMPAEESVIRRATSPMPQDRWRNCREMVIELRKALRLSTDSNFLPEVETAYDAAARQSGPPPVPGRAHTMMPPGAAVSETTGYSGLTPTDREAALKTKTPLPVSPTVVPVPPKSTASRRKVSTRAKLLVSLVLLAGIGATGAIAVLRPDWLSISQGSNQKKNSNNGHGSGGHGSGGHGSGGSGSGGSGSGGSANGDNANNTDLSKDVSVAVDQLVDRAEFAEALKLLKEPEFTPAKIAQERADILESWRAHAKVMFHRADFKKAADAYEQLAEHYSAAPDVNDFRLMQVRGRLAHEPARARQDFSALAPPSSADSPQSRVYSLVKLLIEVQEGKVPSLDELYAARQVHTSLTTQPTGSQGDLWTATDGERKLLQDAAARIIGNWLDTAEKLPAKEKLDDLTKIVKEIDPKNVDAWIAKADAHWELGESADVSKAMAQRATLNGSPRPAWIIRRARALESYDKLVDPTPDAAVVEATLRDLPRVMHDVEERSMLLAAAVVDLGKRDARFLSPAVAALRDVAQAEELKGGQLRRQFVELLKIEIPQRLVAEENFAAGADQLRRDCQLVADESGSPADVPEVIRACHAECLLQLRLPDAKKVLGGPGSLPYSQYVRALVYADRFSGDPKEVESSLKQLFKTDKPHRILLVAGRNKKAIELLDQIADQVRPVADSFKVATLLAEPVAANAAAREMYEVLKNANRWASPTALLPKSQANLAIAAWWLKKSSEDIALAKALSKDAAGAWLKDDAISADDRPLAFSLLHTLLLAHADSKDAQMDRMRLDAGEKLIQVASNVTLDAKDATAFYKVIVEPLEPLASRQRRDGLFADAAGMIAKNPELAWNFSPSDNRPVTVSDKLEELYSEAIEASERKVGEYFKARADLRAQRQDHVGILADAGELKKFKEYAGQAFALEGYVHFLQSRDQSTVPKRYEKLELALKSLIDAEKRADTLPKADQDQVSYFRSLIHTERGNLADLAGDTKIVPQVEFETAIKYAEKVIDSGGGPNLRYAYEAAANAYEDLAWHARVAPEDNFRKAIGHLTNSVIVNRTSPAAHMALARAYYKKIVEAGVDLKNSRKDLATAKKELQEAITLAGDGKNPEAHLWLARVIQATHVDERTSLEAAQKQLTAAEYGEADVQFNKAYSAAKDANLGPVFLATYAYAWAEHALFNPAIKGAQHSIVIAAHSRADQLAALKAGRTVRMDPVQEARILRANADLLSNPDANMAVKVLEQLENAAVAVSKLPADELTRSDVKLIEFRLGLQAKLLPHQLTSPVVQSAMQDALWYSKAEAPLARKEQALLAALKLSQQMATKNTAFVAIAAKEQPAALQRIIDLKRPSKYDFQRHLDIVKTCIGPLNDAKSDATLAVHQRLRQVVRAYLNGAIDDTKKLKRPATETAALEKLLALVPP
jgi:serine/threonine protein kinase